MFVRNELDKIELSYHVTTYADKELFIDEQDNHAVVVIHAVNNHNVYLHTGVYVHYILHIRQYLTILYFLT